MKKFIAQKYITLVCLVAPFFTAFANEEDPFADDVQDVPAAPIDDYISLLLIVAIGIAFYVLIKQNNINKNLKNN